MTFEEEVTGEKQRIDSVQNSHDAEQLAREYVEERNAWRTLAGGSPGAALKAHKFLSEKGLL